MPVCISISFLLSPLSSHFSNFIANSSIQHYIKRYILAFVLNTIGKQEDEDSYQLRYVQAY